MSLWSRMVNFLRGDRLSREIDEEFELHIADAIADGHDPASARRSLGGALQYREASRDIRTIVWLESLRADGIFGWRQLRKHRVTSAAAVLSLALAIGACTSAFRLIDALLLRPLPVSAPERLYTFLRQGPSVDGTVRTFDGCAYPMFRQMRGAVKDQAELIAVSYSERMDLTFGSDQEMEKAYWQYVSGWMFPSFGLRPALGRLLTEADDVTPHGHPYAVLSFDYWNRRFGRDPKVIGRTFRMGHDVYEIIGVVQESFTGTEPGTLIDIFVPTMMAPSVQRVDSTWLRTLVHLDPGVSPRPVRDKLHAVAQAFERERAKRFKDIPKERLERFLNQTALLEPSPTGASSLQDSNRVALMALAALVGLVLLIACANIANLMTARATVRAREMAMRVSIGAGKGRLVQLVLMESAWIASLAAAIGGLFAWWATPFIVAMMNPPDDPVRLLLPFDLRILGFGLVLSMGVTCLFGLLPAVRAAGVRPALILKGGGDPHTRRRLMNALVAVQVAFCLVVLFVGGLFIATYERLAAQPAGFSADRILVLQTVTAQPQLPVFWSQLASHLQSVPGVEMMAMADRTLLDGSAWNGFISTGGPPHDVLAFFRAVSPDFFAAMKIPVIEGRNFREGDVFPEVAIVNETFARTYFEGRNPTGKWFSRGRGPERFQIVGMVRDARYRNLRDPILPVAFFPFPALNAKGGWEPRAEAALIVRTSLQNPLALASVLRAEVSRTNSAFRVSTLRSQQEINDAHTVRERLLALLALFFAVVALLLAAVGLYGVLDYSVLQRRREIGIRMALGARAAEVAKHVTVESLAMVLAGAVVGLAAGVRAESYIGSLLYRVNATEPEMFLLPFLVFLAVALVAVVPAAIRAARTDPATILRAE